jgi:hypothetical protein
MAVAEVTQYAYRFILYQRVKMAPVRVRHPKGIATLQLDLDALTVQDLQQQIATLSEIPPSQQESGLFAVSRLVHWIDLFT